MSIRVAVLAGEASGDQLGASILEALKKRTDVELTGVGGPLLTEQGLTSLFDYTELSLMGIVEILGKYIHLLGRVNQTVRAIESFKPDIVLTIDAPEFCKAVVKRLRNRGHIKTKFVHVVAPTVWAWRPERAKLFAKLFDRLLCLFPFEPPYFEAEGLKADFIGHPATAAIPAHSIQNPPKTLLVLPGSRRQEVKSLLTTFVQSIQYTEGHNSSNSLRMKTLTLPHIRDSVAEQIPAGWDWELGYGKEAKADMLSKGDIAIAASGTMGLELALAGMPHFIAYKLHPLTHFIVKGMIKTPYAHLANIILQKPAVPELLQEKASVQNCTAELKILMTSQEARQAQIDAFAEVRARLSTKKPAAEMAADAILDELNA